MSLGSALSVVGLPATVLLGSVGGCFALVSSGLIIASRKLEAKIKKHQEITTLAVANHDTISRLLSKALNNNAWLPTSLISFFPSSSRTTT